jgi:hypothetical protein
VRGLLAMTVSEYVTLSILIAAVVMSLGLAIFQQFRVLPRQTTAAESGESFLMN